VQISHNADVTRSACVDGNALRRAFGVAWEKVALILTVLLGAADLGELAYLACVTLRQVAEAAGGVLRFVVRCESAEVSFHAFDDGATHSELRETALLQRVRAIVIDSITVSAPIPA
jgi:hypothetical protein